MEIIPVPTDRSRELSDSGSKDGFWYADWEIITIDRYDKSRTGVGVIRFEDKPVLGKVVISFEVEERYRDRGYASQALKALTKWLFWRGDVYEVEATVVLENDPAIHALLNAQFIYRRMEHEDGVKKEIYSITKPKSSWSGLYLFVGIIAGLTIGILVANILMGIIAGVIAGLGLGVWLDSKNLKKRQDVTGRKD